MQHFGYCYIHVVHALPSHGSFLVLLQANMFTAAVHKDWTERRGTVIVCAYAVRDQPKQGTAGGPSGVASTYSHCCHAVPIL